MKNKKYKVTIKMKFETSFPHSQTSMQKAKEEVKKVIENYLKDGRDLKTFFDNQIPQTIYKTEIINNGKD